MSYFETVINTRGFSCIFGVPCHVQKGPGGGKVKIPIPSPERVKNPKANEANWIFPKLTC